MLALSVRTSRVPELANTIAGVLIDQCEASLASAWHVRFGRIEDADSAS